VPNVGAGSQSLPPTDVARLSVSLMTVAGTGGRLAAMPRRLSAMMMARRIAQAAVDITGDDPMRYAGLDAIIARLGIARDEATVAALALAIDRGWLKPNSGRPIHNVSIGPTWQLEREWAKRRRPRKKSAT
jgi:hypothetical protein